MFFGNKLCLNQTDVLVYEHSSRFHSVCWHQKTPSFTGTLVSNEVYNRSISHHKVYYFVTVTIKAASVKRPGVSLPSEPTSQRLSSEQNNTRTTIHITETSQHSNLTVLQKVLVKIHDLEMKASLYKQKQLIPLLVASTVTVSLILVLTAFVLKKKQLDALRRNPSAKGSRMSMLALARKRSPTSNADVNNSNSKGKRWTLW